MIPAGAHIGAGRAGLSVDMVDGLSAVTAAWSSNPLKLLTPRPRGRGVWAYLSNFGGGLVAGDQTSVVLRLGQGACCFLTTQASTKIYRNPAGRPCSHHFRAALQNDSLLVLAPDPIQSFAGSIYAQHQEFHLAPDAALVLLDWFGAGRAACGERWDFVRLHSRNDIYIDGKQCLLDAMLLDSAQGALGGRHRLGRFNCVALISILGRRLRVPARALLDQVAAEPVTRRSALLISSSPLADGVLLRVAGERQEEVAQRVYQALSFVSQFLQDDPWLRKLQRVDANN